MPLKPKHPHNCPKCVFLGAHIHESFWHDLYYCDQAIGAPTVIARYGPEGDYVSGLCFADDIPSLGVAKKFAQRTGLLPCPSPTQRSTT